MMALNLHDVEDLRYEEVPYPERKSGEVLLKIKYAASICLGYSLRGRIIFRLS